MDKGSILGLCLLGGAVAIGCEVLGHDAHAFPSMASAQEAASDEKWPFTVPGQVWCKKMRAQFTYRDERGLRIRGGMMISGAFVFLKTPDGMNYGLNAEAKLCHNDHGFMSTKCPVPVLNGDAIIKHDSVWDAQRLIDQAKASCPSE